MTDFSTQPRRKSSSPADLVLMGVAVLCLALSARASLVARENLEGARRRLEQTRQEADDEAAKLRTLESLKTGDRQTVVSEILLTVSAAPPRVLAALTALLPSEARLTELSLTYRGKAELALGVTARRASVYDLFLKRLTESPLFEDVIPGPENREGEIQASVLVTYRGEGE